MIGFLNYEDDKRCDNCGSECRVLPIRFRKRRNIYLCAECSREFYDIKKYIENEKGCKVTNDEIMGAYEKLSK